MSHGIHSWFEGSGECRSWALRLGGCLCTVVLWLVPCRSIKNDLPRQSICLLMKRSSTVCESDPPPACAAPGCVLITTGMALRVSAPQYLVGSAMTRGVSETTLCLSDLCWIHRGYCTV